MQGSLPAAFEDVFVARGLTKIYRMGETEVHALRGVDLDIYRGAIAIACAGEWAVRRGILGAAEGG